MKKLHTLALIAVSGLVLWTSCKKDDPDPPVIDPIPGCMNPASMNYNPAATQDDGSCEFAKVYMPLTPGNTWRLEDQVNLGVATLNVYAEFTQSKDTTVNGYTYTLQREVVGDVNFGVFSDATYLMRTDNSGKVWRLELGADSTHSLFINYPLSLGQTWTSDRAATVTQYSVVSNSIQTLPIATFTDVVGIQATDLATSAMTTLYFAKDVGLIRADIEQEIQGFPIQIQAELVSYNVQ